MHGRDQGNVPEEVSLSLHNFRDAMTALETSGQASWIYLLAQLNVATA